MLDTTRKRILSVLLPTFVITGVFSLFREVHTVLRPAADWARVEGTVTEIVCANHEGYYYSFNVGDEHFRGSGSGTCGAAALGSHPIVWYLRKDPTTNFDFAPSFRSNKVISLVGLLVIVSAVWWFWAVPSWRPRRSVSNG
jgi:hypothetical protein